MPTNDNAPELPSLLTQADAHGQAALLLVESLIHGLIERSILTTAEAVEIIEVARSVQADVAEASDGAGAKMWQSHSLLAFMEGSLRSDISESR